MSRHYQQADLGQAYDSAVTASIWKQYAIRKIFGTNKASASFFGRGLPALLVFEGEHPAHVYPHEERRGIVTIRDYLESLLGDSRKIDLARQMGDSRKSIGPVGASTTKPVNEGRHR